MIKYIKEIYENYKIAADSDERMLAWAQSYLNLHKTVERDYTVKYEQYKITPHKPDKEVQNPVEQKNTITSREIPAEETDIFKELSEYRLGKSREEKMKPYFIYNDNQLKDLISKMPRNKVEIQKVTGFGEVKVNKYGDEILKIIKKY